MKTLRNVAFLLLMAAAVLGREGILRAFPPPPFYDCPGGCTCTVDYNNWGNVSIDCPDSASAEVCPYAWSACAYYCESTLPGYYNQNIAPSPEFWISCMVAGLDGCGPYSYDPPTSATCSCYCQQG